MNRRRFIASLSVPVVVGGCLGGGNDGQTQASFSVDSDPVPIGFNAVLRTSVTSEGTTDQPPTISLSLENTASGEREIAAPSSTIGLPFGNTVGEGPDGAELGLTDESDELNFDGCWQGPLVRDGETAEDRLSAGEEVVEDRFLYNDAESGGCWTEGDYRFEQEYRMGDPDDDIENWSSYSWGFTVTVTPE